MVTKMETKKFKLSRLPSELAEKLEAEYQRLASKSNPHLTREKFIATVFIIGLKQARRVHKSTLLHTLNDVEVMMKMDGAK